MHGWLHVCRKYVESKYPLDSTALPTDAQIEEWIKGLPAGLPSAA